MKTICRSSGNAWLTASVLVCALYGAGTANAAVVSYFLGNGETNFYQLTISDGQNGAIDFVIDAIEPVNLKPGKPGGLQAFFFNFDDSLVLPMGAIKDANIIGLPDGWRLQKGSSAGVYGWFDVALRGRGNERVKPDKSAGAARVATAELFGLSSLHFSIVGIDGDSPLDYVVGDPLFAAQVGRAGAGGAADSFLGEASAVPLPGAAWLIGTAFAVAGLRVRRRTVPATRA